MILVLNLNASVDKRYMLDDFVPGTVMRAPSVSNTAGGKGIHVARVASLLGEETLTTGFLGGKTGEFIEERLRRVGLPGDFVKVEGATRSCLAFLTRDGGQTEVLEPGPEISCEELAAFREKYTALLARADVVAASGSLPCGVPTGFYAVLIEKARAAGVPFLLDTSGKPLAEGIDARPDFIKPNQEELAALLGHPVETAEDCPAGRPHTLSARRAARLRLSRRGGQHRLRGGCLLPRARAEDRLQEPCRLRRQLRRGRRDGPRARRGHAEHPAPRCRLRHGQRPRGGERLRAPGRCPRAPAANRDYSYHYLIPPHFYISLTKIAWLRLPGSFCV